MPPIGPAGLQQRADISTQGGQPGRPGRRPAPLVVDKSDFDLVTTFEEYEKLKEQEKMHDFVARRVKKLEFEQ